MCISLKLIFDNSDDKNFSDEPSFDDEETLAKKDKEISQKLKKSEPSPPQVFSYKKEF